MRQLKSDLYLCRIPIVILILYGVITQYLFGTVCPYRILLHMECPGCGLSHSCVFILLGQWKRAAAYNIAGYIWLPYLIYLIVYRYFLGKKATFAWELLILAGIVTIGQWIFRIIL